MDVTIVEDELISALAWSFASRREVVADWSLTGCLCATNHLPDFFVHRVSLQHQLCAVRYLVYVAEPQWSVWQAEHAAARAALSPYERKQEEALDEYAAKAAAETFGEVPLERRRGYAVATLIAALRPRAITASVEAGTALEAILDSGEPQRLALAVKFVAEVAVAQRMGALQ